MKTKNFKMTELGPIPKDWEVKRLGNVGEPLMCKRVLKSQTSDSGDVPFYKIGTFGGAADSFISQELFDSFRRQYSYPKKGDVLISAAGTIGRSVVFDGKDAYFQDSNIVWIGNDETVVSNEYLRWCYGMVKWHTEDGGTVSRLYNNNLRETLTLVPPLPEQRKIAAALSDVDEMIAALEKLIEKKRKIKTGAMQRLLTGKTRLPGFKGAWVEKRLGEVGCGVRGVGYKPWQSGITPMVGRVQLLRSNNVQDGRLNFNDVVYVDECCVSGEQRMRVGDILICAANGSRNLVGKAAPLLIRREVTFGAFMSVFRCHDNNQASFVGHLLNSGMYKQKLDDILTGSAINNLNVSDIEDMRFLIPPTLAEQKAIAKVLGDMDEEIAALEAELAKTRQLKQGMMQELLTGKVRLV